ncbi:lecithin retinol acyltransferase family protein [Neobacillus sp. OS1-33]|uniref:lecithin retinol acyltransferase family protein n=1 Tax=Neobacillus sp. OS1-33 TaxID=3070683 RepID=UPI0027DF648A|nr:lecithin retinol acyltransferase family protein [Neobacillus sp. OS1-33]WML26294.1 lecithin retinol acyltransferase family protein [Neobacillus sp. OS1-33]
MSFSLPPAFGHLKGTEQDEIWNCTTPRRADHISVSRGVYNHHGIYISDGEVIHFTGDDADNILDWSKNEVIQTDLAAFLQGGTLEVREYTKEELIDLYPVEHIVHYARACLGDRGYNLIFNNCEHFANMCTLGRFRSKQVERVFDIFTSGEKLPIKGRKNGMGIFGRLGDAWNALWGNGKTGTSGRSSTVTTQTYTYEPDKVKIAEIEADMKIRLANKENERIELMKNARLDILEFEVKSTMAIEEAKARGFNVMVQTFLSMQEKLKELAEKRLTLIQSGSMQIVKEMETFYEELSDRVKSDNDKYSIDKFPMLLSLLDQYEAGTPAHELYLKRIQDDMALQVKHYNLQIESITKRQDQMVNSLLQDKETILQQTGQIAAGILENISKNYKGQFALEGQKLTQPKLENGARLLENTKS